MHTVKIFICESVTSQIHESNFYMVRTVDNVSNLPALLYLANISEHLAEAGWVNILIYSQPASYD